MTTSINIPPIYYHSGVVVTDTLLLSEILQIHHDYLMSLIDRHVFNSQEPSFTDWNFMQDNIIDQRGWICRIYRITLPALEQLGDIKSGNKAARKIMEIKAAMRWLTTIEQQIIHECTPKPTRS
jgi:hypothetical protein